MRKGRPSSMFVVATALVLLALGRDAEQSFVHTDDGCAVEVHCLACRLAVAGPAVLAVTLDLVPRAVLVATLPASPRLPVLERAPRTFEPRGPPLS